MLDLDNQDKQWDITITVYQEIAGLSPAWEEFEFDFIDIRKIKPISVSPDSPMDDLFHKIQLPLKVPNIEFDFDESFLTLMYP